MYMYIYIYIHTTMLGPKSTSYNPYCPWCLPGSEQLRRPEALQSASIRHVELFASYYSCFL